MSTFPFLGEFKVVNDVFTVIESDYDDLPEGIHAEDIIPAVKQLAIARTITESVPGYSYVDSLLFTQHNDMSDDGPVLRYTKRLVVFDGNHLAHRCRHVFNLSYAGADVSVLYGVLRIIASVLSKYTDALPTSCVVCWDYDVPAHRKKASPEYKATRNHDDDPTYEEFISQLALLHTILPDFGVVSLRKQGCEADDLISALVRQTHGDVINVIVTGDKDLYQCVNYHTMVHNPTNDKLVTVANFKEIVGVSPMQYLPYRAMVGDSSDNLAGIKGIGHETAIKLLDTYRSPSVMLEVAAGATTADYPPISKSVAAKLTEFGIQGFMNMLTTMRLDHDLCGAAMYVRTQFKLWHAYDSLVVVKFLKSYMFVSLMDVTFYKAFRDLVTPAGVLCNEPLIRTPRIKGGKHPVCS